jgi:hypothetical protein
MQIVYSDYIRGMNAMAGGNYVTAFSIPGPLGAFFKSVKSELTSLANDIKVEFKDVLKCFANGEAFKLFKALKFSLTALLKGIRTFVALLPRGITSFFQELHDAGYVEKLRTGAVKVDEILHKYPVLKKLAGPVMAGLLFWMWTSMAFTGDPWTDFDVSHIGDAMLGHYSIETLFTSPAGLTGLALLAAGITMPGLPISWLGVTLFNTLIAIAFTLGKKYAPAVAPKIRTLIPKGKFDKRDTSSPPLETETANVKARMSIREMQIAALSPKAYAMFKGKIAELNQDLVGIYHMIKTDGKFPPPLYLVQQANKLRRVANNPANVQNFKDLIKFMEVTLGTAMLKRKVQADGSIFTVEMRDAAKQMMREATKRIEDFANDMDSLDANGPQSSVPALLTSYVDYFVYQLSMLSINGFIIKAELTNAKKVGVLLDKNKTRSVIPRKVKELLDEGTPAPASPLSVPGQSLVTLYAVFLMNLKQNDPSVSKPQAESLFHKCIGRLRNGTYLANETEAFLRTMSPAERREFALNPEDSPRGSARGNANAFLDELVEEAMGLIESAGEDEDEAPRSLYPPKPAAPAPATPAKVIKPFGPPYLDAKRVPYLSQLAHYIVRYLWEEDDIDRAAEAIGWDDATLNAEYRERAELELGLVAQDLYTSFIPALVELDAHLRRGSVNGEKAIFDSVKTSKDGMPTDEAINAKVNLKRNPLSEAATKILKRMFTAKKLVIATIMLRLKKQQKNPALAPSFAVGLPLTPANVYETLSKSSGLNWSDLLTSMGYTNIYRNPNELGLRGSLEDCLEKLRKAGKVRTESYAGEDTVFIAIQRPAAPKKPPSGNIPTF